MKLIYGLLIAGLALFTTKCGEDLRYSTDLGEIYIGGSGTVFDSSPKAFGFVDTTLSEEQELTFFLGNSLFNQRWKEASGKESKKDGLGPLFNAPSCSSCHLRDGRGLPPQVEGKRGQGLLFRLAIGNDSLQGPIRDAHYGLQLQDTAISGVTNEADFTIQYEEIAGAYPDGTPYSLRQPTYTLINTSGAPINIKEVSPRVANHIIGMGLLEAIAEDTLRSLADEQDADGDGISGRPNYVWSVETQSTAIGRFGWKANQPTVRQQVASAFAGDMGITSSLFPNENCPPSVDCATLPNGGDPEISDDDLMKIVLYASALAVPAQRGWEKEKVQRGKALFVEAKCTSCHIPQIKTGEHPYIKGFSNQTIRPYTDLLLHDMGEGLADHANDFLANGREWRTPPLWGIGLFEMVNGHTYYLHDGRARNLEEAILWHDGEAQASKTAFMEMTATEREQLIAFLNSL